MVGRHVRGRDPERLPGWLVVAAVVGFSIMGVVGVAHGLAAR